MSMQSSPAALLAEIGDNFPDSGPRLNWSDLWAYGIAVVVGAVIAAIVMHIRNRNDMTVRCDNPWKLFRELCQVHQLDRHNQRVLTQLVRACQFQQPAEVFLAPDAFDAAKLPPAWRDRAAELEQLRRTLFQ